MSSALYAADIGPARKLTYRRAGDLPGQLAIECLCPEAMHTESHELFTQHLVTCGPEPVREPGVPV